MREEESTAQLDTEGLHFLLSICRYERGLQDFVLVYFTKEKGEKKEIVRYDCAHGFAHRDLPYLPEKDKRRKRRMQDMPLKQQYLVAREDVLRNWRNYWLESRGEEK